MCWQQQPRREMRGSGGAPPPPPPPPPPSLLFGTNFQFFKIEEKLFRAGVKENFATLPSCSVYSPSLTWGWRRHCQCVPASYQLTMLPYTLLQACGAWQHPWKWSLCIGKRPSKFYKFKVLNSRVTLTMCFNATSCGHQDNKHPHVLQIKL